MSNDMKKKFNQLEYIENYNKENYKSLSMRLKHDDINMINNYCKKVKLSKASAVVSAFKYLIDNNIDIADVMNNSDDD